MLGLDLTERSKVVISFIILFIIGAVGLYFVNTYSMKNMSSAYMKQNMAIVGTVNKYDSSLVPEIIPIITKNENSNIADGKEILSRYSYGDNFAIQSNTVVANNINRNFIIFLIFYAIFFVAIFLIYFVRMSKTWRDIKILNKQAGEIVEGKLVSVNTNNFSDGLLDSLNIQFCLMQNRIKSSIDALKDEKVNLKNIINDISHQFKTPIAAMTMYTDILSDSDNMEEEEVKYFMSLTTEQVGRMDWLVKTLLKYARLESNVVEYDRVLQSLNTTTSESVKQFDLLAKEKGVTLSFIDSEKDINYRHDKKWIQEAIMNIIKNGIEHTEKDGFVNVSIDESEMFIRISIKDNGEGISESELPKIFERFHKGSNSVNPKSIGIGLSLSKNIIEANGGSIKVNSELRGGSEFIITFLK